MLLDDSVSNSGVTQQKGVSFAAVCDVAVDSSHGSVVESDIIQGEHHGVAELPHEGGAMMVATLVLAILVAFAGYLALFSEIGFGATLFKALMKAASFYVPVAGLGLILLVVFYIIDFNTGVALLNYLVWIVVGCCMVFAAALCFSSMPHAPLMAFMVTTTVYFAAVYIAFYKRSISPEGYVKALSKACLIGGLAGFLASCVWAAMNFCWWGTDCQERFRNSLRVCSNMTLGDGAHCERYGRVGTTCKDNVEGMRCNIQRGRNAMQYQRGHRCTGQTLCNNPTYRHWMNWCSENTGRRFNRITHYRAKTARHSGM